MNKAELAAVIAGKTGVTKRQAEDMLETMVNAVTTELQADRSVTIAGFGTFSAFVRKAREGVNPQNIAEKIQIGPTKVAKFKAGSNLKSAMKGGAIGIQAGAAPAAMPAPPTAANNQE